MRHFFSVDICFVSTHSRAKAAAAFDFRVCVVWGVSTHSRAEAAARNGLKGCLSTWVSTHSHAEAAAKYLY